MQKSIMWCDDSGNYDQCVSLWYTRLSESSETESDVLKLSSQSEELLPTPASSNDSSLGEGEK